MTIKMSEAADALKNELRRSSFRSSTWPHTPIQQALPPSAPHSLRAASRPPIFKRKNSTAILRKKKETAAYSAFRSPSLSFLKTRLQTPLFRPASLSREKQISRPKAGEKTEIKNKRRSLGMMARRCGVRRAITIAAFHTLRRSTRRRESGASARLGRTFKRNKEVI